MFSVLRGREPASCPVDIRVGISGEAVVQHLIWFPYCQIIVCYYVAFPKEVQTMFQIWLTFLCVVKKLLFFLEVEFMDLCVTSDLSCTEIAHRWCCLVAEAEISNVKKKNPLSLWADWRQCLFHRGETPIQWLSGGGEFSPELLLWTPLPSFFDVFPLQTVHLWQKFYVLLLHCLVGYVINTALPLTKLEALSADVCLNRK